MFKSFLIRSHVPNPLAKRGGRMPSLLPSGEDGAWGRPHITGAGSKLPAGVPGQSPGK